SLLCFHINRVKVAVILAGAALDAEFIVNVIRMLDLAGDRSCRTVLRAFAAADTKLRVDVELTKSCADLRAAFFVTDMFFVFAAEAFQGTDDRKRRAFSEAAQSHALHHGRKFFQFVQIGHLSLAVDDPLQNLQHTLGAFTAGNTFAAAFSLCKAHKESGDFHHTGILVHDNKSAGSHDSVKFLDRIKIKRNIKLILHQTSAGRAADLYSLERGAALQAAADVVNNMAEAGSHRHLDQSRILDRTCQ